jgi:hypothetical protein
VNPDYSTWQYGRSEFYDPEPPGSDKELLTSASWVGETFRCPAAELEVCLSIHGPVFHSVCLSVWAAQRYSCLFWERRGGQS